MQKSSFGAGRTKAAREDTASRVFILWIAAWAVLTLSLFLFHGAGAREAGPDADRLGAIRPAQTIEHTAANDTPIVASIVGLY
jgi:hypothetical protein